MAALTALGQQQNQPLLLSSQLQSPSAASTSAPGAVSTGHRPDALFVTSGDELGVNNVSRLIGVQPQVKWTQKKCRMDE